MNHSCNPNCATQKWIVNGQLRIGLFALRRIKASSELTFDYKYIRFGESAQKCLCGEANCKGVIGEEHKETAARVALPSRRTAQEDDEMVQAMELFTGDSGLECLKDVDLIARLLLRCDDPPSTIPLLATIRKTGDPALLARFITLHGLQIINMLMGTHWRNREIVEAAIGILQSLPVRSRNFVDDSHIEEKLERLSENDQFGGEFGDAASALLTSWSRLESTYRIPKAASSRAQRPERSDVRPSMGDQKAAPPAIPNSPSPQSSSSSAASSSIGYFLGHGISEHYDKKPRWESSRSAALPYARLQESPQKGGEATIYARNSANPSARDNGASGLHLGSSTSHNAEAPPRAHSHPTGGEATGGMRLEGSSSGVDAPQHASSSLPQHSGSTSHAGLRIDDGGRRTDAPHHVHAHSTGRDGERAQRPEHTSRRTDEPEQGSSRSASSHGTSALRTSENGRHSNISQHAHHSSTIRGPSDTYARSSTSSEAYAGKTSHGDRGHLQHPLPEGWQSAISPEGKTYYFHIVTRETSWDPPPNPATSQRLPLSSSHVDRPREQRDYRAASTSLSHPASNPPLSNATEDADRRLQEIIEKAKRSVRERNASEATATSAPGSSSQPSETPSHGGRHLKDSTVSITNRAKPSKGSSAGGGADTLKSLEGRLRGLISAVVAEYLEKWCRDQVHSQKDFQDLSRKLTHGIIDKEMRHLSQSSARSAAMSSSDAELLSSSKKTKIGKYLAQYLRLHGYRVDDQESGQQSGE